MAGIPVIMIGRLPDEPITIGSQMFAEHAFKVSSRDPLPQMPDDCVDEQKISELIPIMPPWVGGPVADDFKSFARGMITPDSRVELCPLTFGGAWFADRR